MTEEQQHIEEEDISVDQPDDVQLVDNEAQNDTPTVRTYKARFYILAVFSLLGVYQCMVWNTFGPISAALLAAYCPEWNDATLALLGNWGNIMYLIPVVPVMWFFNTRGLRKSTLLAAGLMVLGTLVRCLPFELEAFTWMCHLCAILNGIAGIVVFSAPSALSSTWFPPNERTTATGIAIVFNNLGNAFSFLMAPAIVPDPSNATKSISASHMLGFLDEPSNATCPEIDPAEKELIKWRVVILMLVEFGLVFSCAVAILFYFPGKPRHPPSVSSTQERTKYLEGIKKMFLNRNAFLMTVTFSLFNGLVASWFSVMNITFNHLPLGSPENKDRIIGYIGLLAISANCVATVLISRIVDRLTGQMKRTILVLMVAAVLCWIWLGMICLEAIPFSLPQLFVSTILASALTYSTGPIFFEFTVELVYPVPEEIVGGFLTTWYNTVGMIFLFLFYIPGIETNTTWIPYAIMGTTALSVPLMSLVKEEYNRSVVDQFQDPRTTPADHASYQSI